MSDINTVEAEPCIGFECFDCGKYNYGTDTLIRGDDINGHAVDTDVIMCDKCGADNLVIRYL